MARYLAFIREAIRVGAIAYLFYPFRVRVGEFTHYALDMREALAWTRCYPAHFGPAFITDRRTGKTMAVRITEEC